MQELQAPNLHVATFLASAASVEYNWMTRSSLLQHVLQLTASSRDGSTKLGLQARDVRQVDPSLAAPTDALLLVRAGTIVVSASSISMIILKDRCFFIVPQGADSILSTVIRKLVDGGQQQGTTTNVESEDSSMAELPFELRALEATLATVVQQMEEELSGLKTTIVESLKLLRSTPSDPKAQTELFLGSGKLNSFEQRANAVVEVLETVLEQPDNLAYMSLTRLDKGTLIPPTSPSLRSRSRGGSGGSGGGSGGGGGGRKEIYATSREHT